MTTFKTISRRLSQSVPFKKSGSTKSLTLSDHEVDPSGSTRDPSLETRLALGMNHLRRQFVSRGTPSKKDRMLRAAFDDLDLDNSGTLTLDQILKMDEVMGVKLSPAHSLLALFHFDESKEGSFTFKEFKELHKHMGEVMKKASRNMKKKTAKADSKGVSYASPGRTKITRRISSDALSLQQNSRTIKSFVSSGQSDESTGSEDEPSLEEVVGDACFENDSIFFKKFMSKKESRERFYAWLFNLADIDRDNSIEEAELQKFLHSLRNDGINLEDFAYEVGPHETVCSRILAEFDTDGSGRLSRDEFILMADLIMRHYEISQKRRHFVGKYFVTRLLGKGSVGEVRVCIDRSTGKKLAVKVISAEDISDRARLDTEIQAMIMLRNENTVHLYEVMESNNVIYLIMELCAGGSLISLLKYNEGLEESVARYYFQQVLDALIFCHSKGVAHRDFRLDNILLDQKGAIKVADFGQAGVFQSGWDIFSTTLVGSLPNLTPEQANGKAYSGEKVDMWAAGAILYTMLCGYPPFGGDDLASMMENIKVAKYNMPSSLSSSAKDLISRLLQLDPEKRPTAAEVKKHKFITGGKAKNPNVTHRRLGLKDFGDADVEWAWDAVKDTLENLQVHHHGAHERYYASSSKKNDCNIIKMEKCMNPSKMIKFSVTLVQPKKKSKSKALDFNLAEGEIAEFDRLVTLFDRTITPQLAKVTEKWVDMAIVL